MGARGKKSKKLGGGVPLSKETKKKRKSKEKKRKKSRSKLSKRVLERERKKSPILADALLACWDEREEERERQREEDEARREREAYWRRERDRLERLRRQQERDFWDHYDAVQAVNLAMPNSINFADLISAGEDGVLRPECNQRGRVIGWGRGEGRSRNAAMSAAQDAARARLNAAIAAVVCPGGRCPKRLHVAPRLVVVQRPRRRPYRALVAYWAIVGCPRGG